MFSQASVCLSTPRTGQHPHKYSTATSTVNVRAVRIPLKCNLVTESFSCFVQDSHVCNIVSSKECYGERCATTKHNKEPSQDLGGQPFS